MSNFVGGPLTSNFVGVPLREIHDEAGIAPDASQLVGTHRRRLHIGTPLAWVLPPEREDMLVIGTNRIGGPVMQDVTPGGAAAAGGIRQEVITKIDVRLIASGSAGRPVAGPR